MKLFFALLSSFSIGLSSLSVQAKVLIDVPLKHPARDHAVDAVYKYHFLQAYPDRTLQGKRPFTRYELAYATYRFVQFLKSERKVSLSAHWARFSYYKAFLMKNGGDVQSRHWAISALQEVTAYGLLKGEGAKKFNGLRQVTRYELAVIAYNILNWLNLERSSYRLRPPVYNPRSFLSVRGGDVPQNHWAADAVQDLIKRGILLGEPDGKFHGSAPASQYDLAVSLVNLMRLIEIIQKNEEIKVKAPPSPTYKKYPSGRVYLEMPKSN